MKKLLIFFTAFICIGANAQIKEGMVKFTMKLEGNPNDIASQLMGNTVFTLWFKNEKVLMEMTTPVYSMKTLTDSKGMLMLMNAGGQKFFTRKTKEEIDKAKANNKIPDPVIVYTKETKKILGYDCTKAYLTIQDSRGGSSNMTIWHTDKIRNIPGIGPINNEILEKLKGMSLEIETELRGVKSRMTATEVSAKPVPDAVFVLSTAGYAERRLPPAGNPRK